MRVPLKVGSSLRPTPGVGTDVSDIRLCIPECLRASPHLGMDNSWEASLAFSAPQLLWAGGPPEGHCPGPRSQAASG